MRGRKKNNERKKLCRSMNIGKREISCTTLTIMGSRNSIYEKYKIDERPYNDAYHNLMKYLGGREYFGIEDLIKWLSV